MRILEEAAPAAAGARMPPEEDRWEYGSELHWPVSETFRSLTGPDTIKNYYPHSIYHGCGSSIIRQTLEWGQAQRGWKRVWIPSYFCSSVVRSFWYCGVSSAFSGCGLEVKTYHDTPFLEQAGLPGESLTKEDVLFRCNYFSWRGEEAVLAPAETGCDIIEDHCHDAIGAWARNSRATFAFSTLRKLFPLPDGAILWSPAGEPLPPEPGAADAHLLSVQSKLSAMLLKQLHLAGFGIEKAAFRALQLRGEETIGSGGISGISDFSREILSLISIGAVSERRAANFHEFVKDAPPPVEERLARKTLPPGCYPFWIILDFASAAERERVRNGLIERRVYPAIFWTLGDDVADDLAHGHSDRVLALPCDFRYGSEDILRMRTIVAQVIQEEGCRF